MDMFEEELEMDESSYDGYEDGMVFFIKCENLEEELEAVMSIDGDGTFKGVTKQTRKANWSSGDGIL